MYHRRVCTYPGLSDRRRAELPFGDLPLPIESHLDVPERGVRLRQRLVQRECPLGRVARAVDMAGALHGGVAGTHQRVAVGQSRMREREVGVIGNRALEEVRGLLQSVLRTFVPEITALQVQLQRRRAGWRRPLQPAPDGRGHVELQRLGDLARDLFLHEQQIRRRPRELRSPDPRSVARIRQLDRDAEMVRDLDDAAGQHRFDAELAANLLGIGVASLVAVHGSACHHPQLRNLRQVVDETFGQPVTQILQLFVTTGVDERQHRE